MQSSSSMIPSSSLPPPLRYNFATGHPNNEELPVEELQQLFRECSRSFDESNANSDNQFASSASLLRKSMQYGQGSGNPELIAQLRLFLDRQCADDDAGAAADDDRNQTYRYTASNSSLFITEGVSHGLDLLTRVATRPGDVVWCEQPTYYLVADIFHSHGLTIATMPMRYSSQQQQQQHQPFMLSPSNRGGIDIQALADKLAVQPPEALPRMIYVIPANQNPTGYCLSLTSRQELARLARQYNILVVADEVYHLLDWDNDGEENDCVGHLEDHPQRSTRQRRPARIVALNPTPGSNEFAEWRQKVDLRYLNEKRLSGCVSVSSFTKIFAPGVRCGWIEAPPGPILAALNQVGYIRSQGAVGPVMSSVLYVGLRDGTVDRVLQRYRIAYRRRCNLLCRIIQASSLQDESGESQQLQMELACRPTGGYFIWIRFPDVMGPADPFLDYCVQSAGLSFMPGQRCDAAGMETAQTRASTLQRDLLQYHGRLCFAMLNDIDIENGAVLFTQCFRSYMKLRFGESA